MKKPKGLKKYLKFKDKVDKLIFGENNNYSIPIETCYLNTPHKINMKLRQIEIEQDKECYVTLHMQTNAENKPYITYKDGFIYVWAQCITEDGYYILKQ